MFKSLKKYSKLLALALIFSASIPFSSYAVKPQNQPEPIKTEQKSAAKKRKREEVNSDLSKKYDIAGIIPIEFCTPKDGECARCEISKDGTPCNRQLARYYLVPDYSGNLYKAGGNCLKSLAEKSFFKSIHKKIYVNNLDNPQNFDDLNKQLISTSKILNYFLNGKWCKKEESGNFVLYLTGLATNPEFKDILSGRSKVITIFFPNKDDHSVYKIAYDYSYSGECKSSKNQRNLSDDKIFRAFEFFCQKNLISQRFGLKK